MTKEITIVTGFFKINRGNWKGFERTDEQYLEQFKVWARVKNPLVVYVETEEMQKQILEFRSSLGLGDKTVVNIVPDCLELEPELYAGIKEATLNPIQQKFRLLQRNPEVWNPTYNYIMVLKSWCVCDAIRRGQADGMVAWIDFGYDHGGNPIDKHSDFNFLWEYDFPEKMNLFTIQPLDSRPMFEIVFSMDTYVMGGFIVGPANLWEEFWKLVKDATRSLNDCGISDDDQNIMLMAYRKRPELFHLHQSYWSVQMKQFGGEHLKWNPEFEKARRGEAKLSPRRIARKLKFRLVCLRYAYRIYKHMKKVNIH